MAAAGGLFAGCDDDDLKGGGGGGNTTITIVGDMTGISGTISNMDELSADKDYALKLSVYDDEANQNVAIASAPIAANGSFSLDLPSTILSKYLSPLLSDFGGVVPDGINVSDRDFLVSMADLELWEDDVYVGMVEYTSYEYGEDNTRFVDGSYLCLSDRPSDVTGELEEMDGVVFDLHLKKGWNWYFNIAEESISSYEERQVITTEMPEFENPMTFEARKYR
jgi:hypothetical protein